MMQKVILENDDIQIEVIGSCGGKIRSLTSRASGRQWLWHNPALAMQEPRYGQSYVTELDNGGWDEIFPSILPCRVALSGGRELVVPDHGDIVSLAASIRQPDSQTLVTSTRGRCADFDFTRTIRLCGNGMELTYHVTNTGHDTFPFLWCAHPLLRLEKAMTIELGYDVPFTVESAFGAAPFRAGDCFRWDGSKDFGKMLNPANTPFAMKFFSDADSVRAVTVISADRREGLAFSWDTPMIRHLGIWMNYGAWPDSGKAGFYTLGIEPASSPFDHLAKAVETKTAILLEPGQSRQWSMEIALEQYPMTHYHSKRQLKELHRSTGTKNIEIQTAKGVK